MMTTKHLVTMNIISYRYKIKGKIKAVFFLVMRALITTFIITCRSITYINYFVHYIPSNLFIL